MKRYVVYDLASPGNYTVEWRHSSEGTLCEAPDDDISVLDVSESNGTWTATLNTQAVLDRQSAKNAKEAEDAANAYKVYRQMEYPSVHDIIEALMEAEEGRPEKLNQAIAARALVKAKYPKGS